LSNTSKHFSQLTEGELQEWRLLPQTDLLVESLRLDADEARKESCAAATAGNSARSATFAGLALAYDRYADEIMRNRDVQQTALAQDSTWRDPAERVRS
jgi:hypothetical protein